MNASLSQTRAAAYLSGAAAGAIVLILIATAHVRIDLAVRPAPAPACAAHVSPDQSAGLRAEVVLAQAKRDRLVGGGSLYAAARTGVAPGSAQWIEAAAAERDLAQARAQFAMVCGLHG
jgi:hypothetical protein